MTTLEDLKLLYEEKCLDFQQLDLQYTTFQNQSNSLMESYQTRLADSNKKIQALTKELTQVKEKKKSNLGALERELQHIKKEKNDFQTKFHDFQKKVVELENINESLESETRASKMMLNQYEQRVEKTMQELALLQTQLEENKSTNKEQITRLRNQLKETEEELYVVHLKHQKHNSEIESERRSRMSSVSSRSDTPRVQTPVKEVEVVETTPVDFKRKPNKVFHKTIDLVTNLLGELDSKMSKIKAERKTLTAI